MLLRTPPLALCGLLLCALTAAAQSRVGWLRYAIPPDPPRYHALPHTVVLLGNNGQPAPEELTAADELDRGLGHMVAGTDIVLHRFDPRIDAIVLGTTEALHRARIGRSLPGWTEKPLPEEGFRIVHLRRGVREWYILQGGSPRAEMWAAFRFAALVAEDQQLPEDFTDVPRIPFRALDLHGSAGLLPLLEGVAPNPAEDATQNTAAWPREGFLRLLASTGINALMVDGSIGDARRVAALIQPYGMRVWLRSAGTIGDPVHELARAAVELPNFGGIVRSVPREASAQELQSLLPTVHAQAGLLRHTGASILLEDALGPALRDPTSGAALAGSASPKDRAEILRAALEPNVVLQGSAATAWQPLASLASPNFGLLPGMPQVAALDILPAPMGILAYPAPAWATLLQTPEHGPHGDTTLEALLGDATLRGGLTGRLRIEDAAALLHHPLLQANLYAFGRLAWSPGLQPGAVAEEWSRQTWGDDARVHATATRILLESTAAAQHNTTPLGFPLLTRESGEPDPGRAAHLEVAGVPLADATGLGVDRTASGTSEIALFPAAFAKGLSTMTQCPEEWLLLLHRLPYNQVLPGGKTVTQSFYDAHFAGAAQAGNALDAWESTRGLVDERRYAAVHAFLARAATHAEIWREDTTEWMQRSSGLPDTLGFVGSHPGRIEAESMQASGYAVQQAGAGAASGGREMVCTGQSCTVSTKWTGSPNVYRVEVAYLDQHRSSDYQLLVNGEVQAHWQDAAEGLASGKERFVVNGVHLKTGDTLTIHAAVTLPGATAPLDFVEITRDPRWN